MTREEESLRACAGTGAMYTPEEVAMLRWAVAEIDRLRAAIRQHRDEEGHGRCWLDDARLYSALGEPAPDVTLPPRAEFLARCNLYWHSRRGHPPAPDAAQHAAPPPIPMERCPTCRGSGEVPKSLPHVTRHTPEATLITCPACHSADTRPHHHLGYHHRCRTCDHVFREPIDDD